MCEKNPLQMIYELGPQYMCTPNFKLLFEDDWKGEKIFTFELEFMNLYAFAQDKSKKLAKKSAATMMLEILKSFPKRSKINDKNNYIGELLIFCERNKKEAPTYSLSEAGPDHKKIFTYECQVGNSVTTATENRKKIAKQMSAKRMIEFLNSCDTTEPPTKRIQLEETLTNDNSINPGTCNEVEENVKKYIEELRIFNETNKKEAPTYSLSEAGPDHKKIFTYECQVGNSVTTAMENKKNIAKQMSAKRMIEFLNSCDSTEPPTKRIKLEETLTNDNSINPGSCNDDYVDYFEIHRHDVDFKPPLAMNQDRLSESSNEDELQNRFRAILKLD